VLGRLRALARILMTPVALDLAATAYRSPTARALASQAVHDPAGLARRLADPKQSVPLMQQAGRHVRVRDMAQLGLLAVPLRYGLLSELALWGLRRATRGGGRRDAASPRMKNVTPRDADAPSDRSHDRARSRGR
jgi:hypothetical protein